jgi:hypothetical protein
MAKENVGHIHCSTKGKCVMCNNRDLEDLKLNEISRHRKTKYHMVSLTCVIQNSRICRSREWNDGYQRLAEWHGR